MRRALGVLAIVALIAVGAWAYTRPGAPAAAPSPSPTATATGTAAASPTPVATPAASATPSPTAAGSPGPTFGSPVLAGDVTVRAAPATAGADFRYIVTGDPSGGSSWVVLLDLGAKTAQTVAQIDFVIPPGSQAAPRVEVSSTSNGERVLIVATETGGRTHFFLLEARRAAIRNPTSQETFSVAVIAPDGSRFAFSDTSSDPARSGIWVSSTNGGQHERVIVDDPATPQGRPRPVGFSPDNSRLAAVVDVGGQKSGILIAPSGGGEVGETGSGGGVLLEPGAEFDWAGEPDDAWAWEGVSPLGGGANAIYSFNTRTGNGALVYRPPQGTVLHDFARSPKLDRFMTSEGPGVIGQERGAIWVRTRDGGATKVTDLTETGPSFPWWSPDGSRLYAFTGGDDSVGSVVELLTGEVVLSFCRRGPGPECV